MFRLKAGPAHADLGRMSRFRWLLPLALAALLVAGAVALSLRAPLGADYPGPTCATCDYPGPSIDALVAGDAHGFFTQQPVMGSVSLLLRAPVAALADGQLWRYRLGALACLLVLVGIALLVAREMRVRRRGAAVCGLVAALMVCGPLTTQALRLGHPEELLAGGLCVAAILLAARGRGTWAGVALGLALATKPWALFAIVPVLMASPASIRLRAVLTGAGVAAAFTLPMLLGDPERFISLARQFSRGGVGLTPVNVWWGYGHVAGQEVTPHGTSDAFALPHAIASIAHPLITLLAVGGALAYWRLRPNADALDALGVFALAMLARCLLDPLTYGYHHAPFLLGLLAWEGLRRRGLPWAGLAVTAAAYVMSNLLPADPDPSLINRVYLAWAVPVAGWLFLTLWFPAALRRARTPAPAST